MISVIIPCFNEKESLQVFYPEIKKIMNQLGEYELIFIDDGSTDTTLDVLKELSAEDTCVTYLSFSRNFGKEAAIYAGLANAKGDYVTIMDADLQHPPALLLQMMEILQEHPEYDSVAAYRTTRNGEHAFRSFCSRLFYKLINRISDVKMPQGATDYRLMKKDMGDAILSLSETNRFSKGIFGWVGFNTYWLPYENIERVAGETKWNSKSLFRYAIEGIMDFSHLPLSIVSWLGSTITFFSVIALLYIIIKRLVFGDPVAGWASTICVIIFMGGMQMLFLGIIGQYLSKVYLEVKQRPHYIIARTNKDNVKKIG